MIRRTAPAPRDALVIGGCVLAWAAHLFIGLSAHHQLRTPGFDLSVFDYAIWNTGSGGPLAFVPMFGYSLFAQHFMPALLLLAPFGALFKSPVYLIVLQSTFFVVGAYLMYRFAVAQVRGRYAVALLVAYLLSRRTHSAATSYFYIESAEPMLVFGALLAWTTGRRGLYWLCVFLALGCKEDMAVYFAAFGVIEALAHRRGMMRNHALLTTAVALAWLAAALFVAIPFWSQAYGLGTANPFFHGRFGAGEQAGVVAAIGRVFSTAAIAKLVTVTSAVGFLCFLAPRWFAIALIGIAFNLAALPGTTQAGVSGHYLWPIVPWLFIAAVYGAKRLGDRAPTWVPWIAMLIAVADTPVPAALGRAATRDPAAASVLTELRSLDVSKTVLAQSNLIPHLPRRNAVFGYSVYADRQPVPELVLLTNVGDTWPLGAAGVDREVAVWRAKSDYEELSSGPLWVFRIRPVLNRRSADRRLTIPACTEPRSFPCSPSP